MITILRSRFQPFTKYHWEVIKSIVSKREKVVLCVVRDYETISRWHKKTSEVKAVDLRHLPIFNPFTTWGIISHIHESLCKFMKKDRIIGEYWFYRSIHLIFSPLKFSELVEVITQGGEGKIVPVNFKKFADGIKCPCETIMRQGCQLEDYFGKLLSIISYDIMPLKESRWLFPIFDLEDNDDYSKAENGALRADRISVPHPPKFEIKDLLPPVGLYGSFILWIYLNFLRWFFEGHLDIKYEHNIPSELRKNMDEYTDRLTKILKEYLADTEQWDSFEGEVGEMVDKLLDGFDSISPTERNLLLNFYHFAGLVRDSVRFQEYS
jgi:hypothetical protein